MLVSWTTLVILSLRVICKNQLVENVLQNLNENPEDTNSS